jgi:hypothetical protein
MLVGLTLGGTLVCARNIASFLAVTEPQNARYLIVEGWQDEYSLRRALKLFHSRDYDLLITTGGPDLRYIQPIHKTYAEQSAAFFVFHGVEQKKLIVVATHASAQDRTFLSAVMVRKWFEKKDIHVSCIDVFTQDVHARRTRKLYEMAFQSKVDIGIYASKPANYSLTSWWNTSEGAKSVITESIGLLWVSCCFNPGKYGSHQELWGLYDTKAEY